MADEEKNTVKFRLKFVAQKFYEELQQADVGMKNVAKSADNMAKLISDKAKEMKVSLRDMIQPLDEEFVKYGDAGRNKGKFSEAFGKASIKTATNAMYQEQAEAIAKTNKEKTKGVTISAKELALAKAMAKPYEDKIKAEAKIAASREKSLQFGYAMMQETAQIANLSSPTKGNYVEGLERTKNLLMSISKNFGVSIQEAAKFAQQMGINKVLVTDAVQQIDNKFRGLAGALKKTFSNIQNYISTAFGVTMAMLLFKAQMAITQFFQESIKAAREFRDAMVSLDIAEAIISQNGLDITRDEIDGLVEKVMELDIGLGRLGASKLVADIMEGAKNIPGITKPILDALIMTAAVGSKKGVSPEAVVNSFIDRKKQSLNGIVIFNEEMIKQEAIRLGIVKNTNAVLTEQQKNLALGSLYATQSADAMEKYKEETADTAIETENIAKQQQENLTVAFGQGWLSLITNLKSFFIAMYPTLLLLIDLLNGVVVIASATFKTISWYLDRMATNIQLILSGDLSGAAAWTKETFEQAGEVHGKNIIQAFMEGFEGSKGGLGEIIDLKLNQGRPDTPTGEPTTDISGTLTEEQEEINKELDNILEDMSDFYGDMVEMEEDYQQDKLRAREDFEIDLLRMKEDYEHDMQMVQQESNNDLAEENADYQNEELEAELKFQEDMRQLREKFLFDLEDALAQRDARQVIRLQKQYAMDVTNKTNEYELAQQARQRDHEQELADIQSRVAERLAELKYEYELRKARAESDFLLEQQRADQDHTIDMARRQKEFEDKVAMWTDELVTEHGMKVEAAQLLLNDLKKFYGVDGAFHQMYYASYQDILNMTAQFRGLLNSMLSGGAPTMDLNRKVVPGSAPRRYAEGGAAVANKPTTAMFGEAGKELALFIPFNKLAQLGGAGGKGSGGSATDKVQIEVGLSPDLVGRVVNASMEGVAEVITRVSRG